MTYKFTVNTDASFDPGTGIAAWAYWIKSDHYHFTAAGLFPEPLQHSGIAELRAIEIAVLRIWQVIDDEPFLQYYGREGNISVLFNTDSKFAINMLTDTIKKPKNKALQREIRGYLEGLDVEFRHVKAHTRNPSSRSWVNRWCDREAIKLVREKVRALHATRTTEKV